jgi:hypothetical protein
MSDWETVKVTMELAVRTPLTPKAVEDAVSDLVYKRDLKSLMKDALVDMLGDDFEFVSLGVTPRP